MLPTIYCVFVFFFSWPLEFCTIIFKFLWWKSSGGSKVRIFHPFLLERSNWDETALPDPLITQLDFRPPMYHSVSKIITRSKPSTQTLLLNQKIQAFNDFLITSAHWKNDHITFVLVKSWNEKYFSTFQPVILKYSRLPKNELQFSASMRHNICQRERVANRQLNHFTCVTTPWYLLPGT